MLEMTIDLTLNFPNGRDRVKDCIAVRRRGDCGVIKALLNTCAEVPQTLGHQVAED